MTMKDSATHLLEGLVKCRNCGVPMTTTRDASKGAPQYACPNPRSSCDTPELEVESLNRIMITTTLNAILSDENTRKVVDIVKEQSLDKIAQDLLAPGQTTDIGPILRTPHPVETDQDQEGEDGPPPPRQNSEREHIPTWRSILSYGSLMMNTERIAEYSLDPENYLRPTNIQTTRAIMELAVEEILAGHGSVTVRYRTPMPPGDSSQTRTSEEVAT